MEKEQKKREAAEKELSAVTAASMRKSIIIKDALHLQSKMQKQLAETVDTTRHQVRSILAGLVEGSHLVT